MLRSSSGAQPAAQRSPSSGLGLQTSGRELREMLEKSGARHRLEGAEKLDFLVWLADQVKGSVEERRKMKLKLAELNEFLAREQVAPEGGGGQLDAKGAVSGLLALRRRELARLSYDGDRSAAFASGDACFELVLAGMPAQDVSGCFAGEVVLYDDAASGLLPGQIASPRRSEREVGRQGSTREERGSYRHSGSRSSDRHSTAGSRAEERRPPPPPLSGSPPSHFLPSGVPPPPSFRPPEGEEAARQSQAAAGPRGSASCSLM
mmetsp:Transcript_80611/g.236894  ORF Transcript_80611/g.236894 Transcript_80611/m.236894 type:complete len:263 (-) Transcript_80611:10-798(-)